MAADAVPRAPSGLCRRCVRGIRAPTQPLMNFTFAAILLLIWGIPVNAQKQRDCNPDAPATYTAAVLEYSPALGVTMENAREHFQQNVRNYAAYTKEAKRQGADIVVFPECGLVTLELPHLPDSSPAVAVRLPGNGANPCVDTDMDYPSELRELSCAARDAGIYVVVNLPEEEDCEPALAFCPECPGFDPRAVRSGVVACTTQGKRFFNSDVAFDRNGAVVARYRKYNLFGEAGFVPPAEPPLAYFDTDFGVRFGLFTCFDLMFEQPAVALVAELGISDVVFPTAWFSELPFLTAVQAQASWAWLLDVNMLAAGYNLPEVGSTGTGIYSGRRGKVVATMEKERTNKLLVGRLPNRYACAGGARGGGRAKGEEAERKRVKIVVLSRKDWDPPPPPPLTAPAAPPCATQLPRHADAAHAPSLYSCHLQSLLDKPKDQGVHAGKAGTRGAQWPEWEEKEWAIEEEAEGAKKPNKKISTAGWADLVDKIDKTKRAERAEKKVTAEGAEDEEEDKDEEEEEEAAVEVEIQKEVKAEEEDYDEEEGAEGLDKEEVDLEEEQRLDEAELLEATAPLDEAQERAFIHGPRYARYIRDVLYPSYKEIRAHGKDKEKEKEPSTKGKEMKEKQAKEKEAKEQKPASKGAEEVPSFDDTVAEMSKNIAKHTGEDAARIEVAQYQILLKEEKMKDEGEEKEDDKPHLDSPLSHAMEGDVDEPGPEKEDEEDEEDLEELAAEDDRYQEEMDRMVHHVPLIDDPEFEGTTKATPGEGQDTTRGTPLHPTLAIKVFRAGEDDPFPEMAEGREAKRTTHAMKATTEATPRGRADDKKPADKPTVDEPTSEKEAEKDVKIYKVIDDTEEKRIAVDKKIKEKEYEEEKSQKEEKWKSSKCPSEETFKPTSVSDMEKDVKVYQVIDDTEEKRIAVDKKIKEKEYEEEKSQKEEKWKSSKSPSEETFKPTSVSDMEKDVKVYQVIDDTEERRIAVDKKIKEKEYEEEKSQKEEKCKSSKYPETEKVSEKERIEESKVLIDEKIVVDFEPTEQVMQDDVTGVEGQVVDTGEILKEERKIPKCVKKTKKFTEIKHTFDERDETSAENLQPISPEASEYEDMISETKEETGDTMLDEQKETEDEYLTMRQPASDKLDAEEKEMDHAEDSEKGVVISEKGEKIDETRITIDEEVSEYEDKIIEDEENTKRQVKEYMETDEGISEEKEETQETKIVVDKEIDFDFESFDDVTKGEGEESLDEDVIMRQPMEGAEETLEYSEEVKKEYRKEEEMGKELVEEKECTEESKLYQARTEEETWRKDDYGMRKQPEEEENADEDYEDYCAEYEDKEDMEITKGEEPEVPSKDEIPRVGKLEERPPKCECVRRRIADAAARGSSATDAGEPTPDGAPEASTADTAGGPEASKADTEGAPKPAGGLYRNRLTGRDEGYLYLKTEDLSQYVTILIPAEHPPPAVHENSSLHLCHGTFCCKFEVQMDVSAELSIDPVLLKASGIGHWQGSVPEKDEDLTLEDMEPSEEAIRAAKAAPSEDMELQAAFEDHAPQALSEGDEKVEPSTPRPEQRATPSKEEDIPAFEDQAPQALPEGDEKPKPQRPCARWEKRRVPREETSRRSVPAQHDEPRTPAHGATAPAPGEDDAPRRYYYRAVVFNGRRTFDGVTEGGLQVCAVIPCTSTNVESCGKLHGGDVDMEQVVFRHVRISGRFTRVRSLPLPSTLDTHLMPLPSDTFTLKATLRTYESNIVMETHKSLSFLTFGIYNRNFANDPDRQPTIG